MPNELIDGMFKVVKGPLSAIPLPGNAVRPAMRVSGPPRPVKIPHRLSGSAPRHPRKATVPRAFIARPGRWPSQNRAHPGDSAITV